MRAGLRLFPAHTSRHAQVIALPWPAMPDPFRPHRPRRRPQRREVLAPQSPRRHPPRDRQPQSPDHPTARHRASAPRRTPSSSSTISPACSNPSYALQAPHAGHSPRRPRQVHVILHLHPATEAPAPPFWPLAGLETPLGRPRAHRLHQGRSARRSVASQPTRSSSPSLTGQGIRRTADTRSLRCSRKRLSSSIPTTWAPSRSGSSRPNTSGRPPSSCWRTRCRMRWRPRWRSFASTHGRCTFESRCWSSANPRRAS